MENIKRNVPSKIIQLGRYVRLLVIKTLLYGRFHSRNALLISSSPRSGSTWLSTLLLFAIPRSCSFFEPLHLRNVPKVAETGFDWRTYKSLNEEWPAGKAFLEKVFRGQILNEWIVRETTVRSALVANKCIIKSVRLNRLLPWVCQQFKLSPPVLLIRHPCAVIASQLQWPDWRYAQRPSIPSFVEHKSEWVDTIQKSSSVESHLAVSWALDQLVPLIQAKPFSWIIVTYEDLLRTPKRALARIAQAWNVPISNIALDRIQKPSSTVSQTGISGLNGWKRQLSADQIKAILNVTTKFGLDFYLEDTTPLYDPAEVLLGGSLI